MSTAYIINNEITQIILYIKESINVAIHHCCYGEKADSKFNNSEKKERKRKRGRIVA